MSFLSKRTNTIIDELSHICLPPKQFLIKLNLEDCTSKNAWNLEIWRIFKGYFKYLFSMFLACFKFIFLIITNGKHFCISLYTKTLYKFIKTEKKN